MFTCVRPPCLCFVSLVLDNYFVLYVGFFCMVSSCVVYFMLFATIGISFCLEIRPMLGKACGKIL